METAATFIGIAGVASVLQSLLQCYDDFLTARDFGRDYKTAALQLRLLQNSTRSWGLAIGLIDENEAAKKQFLIAQPTEENMSLISEVMSNIKALLNDATTALDEYTVSDQRNIDQGKAIAIDQLESPIVGHTEGNPDLITFEKIQRLYEKINRSIHRRHDQQHPGTMKRTKWALISKNRLRSTVEDITALVDRLNTDFPPIDTKQQLMLSHKALDDMRLTDDEISVLADTATDRVFRKTIEMTAIERNTGSSFEEILVMGDAAIEIGDYVAADYTGQGMPGNTKGDKFGKITVSDTAFAKIGTQYGGKTALELRFQQQEERRAKAASKP